MKLLIGLLTTAVLLAAALSDGVPSGDSQITPKSTSLVVLYTCGARGQIRSCNCTKFRYGGYGREMTLLKSIRKEASDVILVEGGDLCAGTDFQASLKAEVAAKALKVLQYDAMVPGEEDLGVRGADFMQYFHGKSAPVLCANLYKGEEPKPLYEPYRIFRTTGGLRVAIIGLLDPESVGPLIEKTNGMTVKNPSETLAEIMKELQGKSDVEIVVYHGTAIAAEELANIEGVDLILAAERADNLVPFPTESENRVDAPVVQKDGCVIINAATKSCWSLGRIDLQIEGGAPKSAKHQLFYLDRRYDEDPEMVRVYDDYNHRVKETVLARSEEFRKSAEALLVKRGFNVAQMRERLHKSVFATAAKCKDCHSEAYEKWSKSRHATAMATLQKTGQDFDPECVGCHATGVMVRNGYKNPKETPELGNVQCEACHGPALGHISSPAKGFGKTGEQVCRSCHTDERTPDFNFAEAWEKIKH